MPDKVQDVDAEAQIEENEQEAVHDLLPKPDFPVHEVQRQQQEHECAGVDVRPVVKALLRLDERHMPCEHIDDCEVLRRGLREVKVARRRHLQRIDLRQQRHRRQPARDQRVDPEAQDTKSHDTCVPDPLEDIEADEVDDHEDAGHDGDIVVRKNREPQCDHIKHRALAAHEALEPQHDQRKQDDAVEPHEIPAVRRDVAGQRIQNRDEAAAECPLREATTKIPAHRDTREADLHNDHVGHELEDQSLRTEKQQPVQRTREIVGIERAEIDAETDIPAVQQ